MTDKRPIIVLALLALLSACGGGGSEEGDGRSATGEVLEGTISDAMLPLDQLRSEAPLAPPEPGEGGPAGTPTSTEAPDGEEAAEADGEATPEGTATPTVEVTPAF